MSEGEGGGGSAPYAGLIEGIHARFDAAIAEVEQQRAHDRQDWLAFKSKLDGEEAAAKGQSRGLETRDEYWGKAKNHWGGVKTAENTQRAEDKSWRSTEKADRATAQEGPTARSGLSR